MFPATVPLPASVCTARKEYPAGMAKVAPAATVTRGDVVRAPGAAATSVPAEIVVGPVKAVGSFKVHVPVPSLTSEITEVAELLAMLPSIKPALVPESTSVCAALVEVESGALNAAFEKRSWPVPLASITLRAPATFD